MADRLTQLQDALDQLATQFYSTIRYLNSHHDYSPLSSEAKHSTDDIRPDPPGLFAQRQRELARDLVVKEQQIEYLIGVLPGIGTSEREQEARLKTLEGELKEAERERQEAMRERVRVRAVLDQVIGSVKRV
ncbi:MAG: RNA polymerase II mediator complex subunit [Trichoglossum hirsutum]|nr:MAG: RNA polymerase II mediator complex subunit [Trichoglossum hirsutum]